FVYISSTSVYGEDAGEWVDEETQCRPRSSNGQVCLDAELELRTAIPSAIVLRLAGIYGPGRLIARIDSLRSGVPLEGNPDAWLNLIHVDDAVETVQAAHDRGPAGATYVVADDRPHRRGDYYSLLARLIGAPPPVFAQFVAAGDAPAPLNKRCRNRRIREELQVALRYPTLAEGLPAALGPAHSAPPA
ncbi:MAG: NAD-dependent epimerase/dehydratase family protein, partial [Planctomycetales bacterium]